MKSTPTLKFSLKRLFFLTLISFVAVAALLGIAASANKANRAAKARAEQAANTKSAINPTVLSDKQGNAPTVASITATLSDNVTPATKVVPGGTINYTAVITNGGVVSPGDDATSVQYNATIDPNTSFVVGSAHASPIATNNAYTTVGNTLLEAGVAASGNPAVVSAVKLFDNDTIATAPDIIQLVSFTAASANGGTVSVNADGSFTYLPPVGFTGADTFTYTIRNNTDATLTDTGTVTVTVGAPRVWYVNNSGANGDGRSTSPFNTLANAAAVDAANDIIYVFTGGGNYTGGITLLNGEQVIGNGVALVVNTFTLRAAGARPTVVNAGGNGITLAQNNTLSGFNFGNCTGFAIQGTSVGTLAVSTMLINTTGGALDLTGVTTPTVSVVLDSTNSTGGTSNVRLVGLNGTVTLGSGALSGTTAGAANHALFNSGGNAALTFSGSITKANQGNVVNIGSRTGGAVTLSGAITGSGSNGINVSSNTGGTIDFTNGTKTLSTGANAAVTLATNTGTAINFTNGGLDIDTTSGAGFNATGGGTVTVTTGASPNTIDSTTGTALTVTSTTIGAGGLTFRSISSSGAANGINLNATGASGGLTVTGNGSTCTIATPTCDGGSIQSSTGAGITLTSTQNVSLTRMKIQNSGTDGIATSLVNGFTLDNSIVTDSAGVVTDEGLQLFNTSGTLTLTNIAVSSAPDHQIFVDNNNTNMASFVMTNSTAQCVAGNPCQPAGSIGNQGLLVQMRGTSILTSGAVTGCTFSGVRTTGMGVLTADTARIGSSSGGAIVAPAASNSFTVQTSSFTNNNIAIDFSKSQTSNMAFQILNNTTITGHNSHAINIATAAGAATGPASNAMVGKVDGNVVGTQGTKDSGSRIGAALRVVIQGANTQGSVFVNNNTFRETVNSDVMTFISQNGAAASGTGTARFKITNNVIPTPSGSNQALCGPPATPCAGMGIFVLADEGDPACNVITGNNIYDVSTMNGTADVYLAERVGPPAGAQLTVEGTGGSNSTYIQANNTLAGPVKFIDEGGNTSQVGLGACGTFPSIPEPVDTSARNIESGDASANVVARVESPIAVPVVNVPAAQTPVAMVSSKDGIASVAAKATPKSSVAKVAGNARNEARLSHHAVRSNLTAPSQNAPLSNLPVSIGTLPAAKTITIKYQVLVNSTAPTARQAGSLGTVTGNGPGAFSVTTTDPGPPVVNGPTVTLIDTSITWTGATNTDWNTPGNWNLPGPVVSTYAPGVTNPAINEVTIPAVATQPTLSATDVSIFSLSLANTMTLTITNPRILTIGAPAAGVGGDLALNGIITGGFLNFGTGSHFITNTGTGSLSATNVATVLSGSSVVLSNNLQAGALAINAGGSMDITGRTLSLNGAGGLAVPGGATFTTATSTVIFNGTAAQQAAGIAYNNLTINNTIGTNVTGVTLTGNATVNGALALTSSDLNTGAFTLTQPNTTPSTGVSDVVGSVRRTGGPFAPGALLTFGNPNNQITFNGAGGTKPTDLTVNLVKAAPGAPQAYPVAVNRTYTISKTGGTGFTSTLRLHYLDTELNGNLPESSLNLRWFRAAPPIIAPPGAGFWPAAPTSALDGGNNWVESNPVTETDGAPNNQFLASRWTFAILPPTATNGVITGRIVDANGNPVEGAVIRLEGTQTRKIITDANGVYRFEEVETTGFYTVTPSRVNFEFSPSARSFSQLGDITSAIFTASATGQTENPLDTPEYFVRQHYVDFLGREPDESGFNFWSDQIIECGFDQDCIERRRENGSAAFFLSIEFQQTGGLVDKLYRASYGAPPQFADFMPDTRIVGQGVVVGREGWEARLRLNKEAFVAAFVNRPAFHAAYDGMDSSTFVDTLISHTGVNFTASERDGWVSGLANGSQTRADVLRSIAENQSFVNAKFNETFVMMEYFGYLRRDGDADGFAFWLNKLNQFGGNFQQAEMVKAFIVSGEFRGRFPR